MTAASQGPAGASDYKLILAPDPPRWSAAQSWAYALGAPYHVQHRLPLNALPEPQERIVQLSAAIPLKRDWSVESSEALVGSLNWLGAQGHRQPFGIAMRRYCLLPYAQVAEYRQTLRAAGEKDPDALEELWRLDAVQANTDGIRGGVLIGFDAARAVLLARQGCQLGWLSEPQMWDYMLDVARDVQRHFTSWAEYAADFLLSRHMWRASSTKDHFDAITERLLSEAASPWRSLPWRVPGLEIPRSPRPLDPRAPVWSLERWDS